MSHKRNICGVLVDAVSMDDAVDVVMSHAADHAPLSVSALAVHGVVTGFQDDTQRARLNALDLIVCDGQPVRWALNLLHRSGLRERVYGPQLMLKLCERAAVAGLSIYLYGSTREVLAELEKQLTQRFPTLNIAGSSPSRFRMLSPEEQLEIAKAISVSGASMCFVGLGCPRQETFCWGMRDLVGLPLLAVGAAFDFHAGLIKEAPEWMQRSGLQWLHRFFSEPRRLWRRYFLLNPLYLTLLAAQFLRIWIPRTESLAHADRSTPAIPG